MNPKTLRGQQWIEFSEKVLSHIESYTVPQYGDYGEDIASDYTPEVIRANLVKYLSRAGREQRPDQLDKDCLKMAHYTQMLFDIIQKDKKETNE